MPADPPAALENARMITFIAIAPDGSSERLSFATEAEAQAAAEDYRNAGHSISWRAWAETLGRWVSIPED
jgi:hypothetical protein